jgi:hypothetical protein
VLAERTLRVNQGLVVEVRIAVLETWKFGSKGSVGCSKASPSRVLVILAGVRYSWQNEKTADSEGMFGTHGESACFLVE